MTKEDIIAGLRRKPVPFEVSGLSLLLKPWTAATRTEFAVWRKDNPGPGGLFSKLAALSLCSEDGTLMFEASDLEGLDGLALEQIARRALELNGLGGDDSGKA